MSEWLECQYRKAAEDIARYPDFLLEDAGLKPRDKLNEQPKGE